MIGFRISQKEVESGLLNVISNTSLLGRWQIIQKDPKIICDLAHNKEGLVYAMEQLNKESYAKLHMVLGFVNDKNLDSIIDLFPKHAAYYFCRPKIERGLNEVQLRKYFLAKGYNGNAYDSVTEALNNAKFQAHKNDLIYVGGSTFVVAEII